MTEKNFRVGIVGGGIGGLALAQGLKKAGVSVAVYERDSTPTDRLQGFRIRISPKGSAALHDCLPGDLFDLFTATCSADRRRFRFLTEKMEELLSFDFSGEAGTIAQNRAASRITLRQILLARLDGIVEFGKVFSRYEETEGGIVLHFADGSTATCDVLVGADGGNSRVRQQFLPHARRVDTGVLGIAAKAMLTADNRRRLPPRVLDGTGLVMSPGRCSMFIGLHEFATNAPAVPAVPAGDPAARHGDEGALSDNPPADNAPADNTLADNTTSYVFWAYSGQRADLERGTPLERLAPPDLQRLVLDHIRNWHPDYSVLVCASDPSTFYVTNIRTSVPVASWPSRRITLIGDAIHSMTPYRGIGANIALRDAALLYRKLAAASVGEISIEAAIHDYERQMREYAFAAVRSSLRALEQAVGNKGIGFRCAKLFFRAANAAPPLKRLAFASFAEE
jgi:2-polyprenyl-6-methoxyphenol hydroxylase-like FAD-dependent oxidoreductase